MPLPLPRPRLIGLTLLSVAISAATPGLAGTAPGQVAGATTPPASTATPTSPQPAVRVGQPSSAQSQEAARAAAERILQALRSRNATDLYRLFSPNLQRMTSPALVKQRLAAMAPVRSWTIGQVEPGLDSNTVATRLRGSGGERNLLLVIDADGLLEGFHMDASDQAAEAVARRFVDDLSRGRYVSAQALLSPDLQAEIPASRLQIKWQRLQRLTGDFVAIRRVVRAESTIDSKLVLVTTSFQRLTDSLFVILDSSNRIVGVDFPSEPATGPGGV
ncbi:MAG: DUF3887 domain-containing protein [Cyanobium sp.]